MKNNYTSRVRRTYALYYEYYFRYMYDLCAHRFECAKDHKMMDKKLVTHLMNQINYVNKMLLDIAVYLHDHKYCIRIAAIKKRDFILRMITSGIPLSYYQEV